MTAPASPLGAVLDPLGASLFEASEDCVKLVSLGGVLEGMNANGVCLMEIDDFEAMRGMDWAALWPEQERPKILAAVAHAAAGQVARLSAECPTAKGTPKSWDVLVSPVLDDAGRPVRLVSISRDVTKLARAQEENVLLAQELAHRIRNMAALIDGVIAMSARAAAAEVQPFADTLRERLRGLGRALAHVSPSPPGHSSADAGGFTLHGLMQSLLAPYGGHDGGAGLVAVSGEDLAIGRSAVTSIALFVNELATNALKYGALSRAEGRVTLTTRRAGSDVELVWEEHGAPAPDARPALSREGFGTTLMGNAVERQLRGQLKREWGPGGIVVRIRLPLERLSR